MMGQGYESAPGARAGEPERGRTAEEGTDGRYGRHGEYAARAERGADA